MQNALMAPAPASASVWDVDVEPEFSHRTQPAEFIANVDRCKEYVRAGDAFQIVLSQRFDAPVTASALDVYRVLRVQNPSPYMYLFRFPEADISSSPDMPQTVAFDVVGSSPEALVKLTKGRAMLHPIAGTRRRGASIDEDNALAADLMADLKERAEHLMLVDLGRNDLGRVCASGTVEVTDFMSIERYSHVMHIVSTVEGEIAPDKSAYDLLAATFPAGTLSGAPKPRAMEIIEELEQVRRGVYGGCVGYLDFAGDMDTAIAIRTATLRNGMAYVQAGAGVVADSDPQSEHQECLNKAAAVLRAVAVANTLKELS
jgi:anthranilate synthase component 1